MKRIVIVISVLLSVCPGIAQSESTVIPSMSGTLDVADEFAMTDPEDSLHFAELQKKLAEQKAVSEKADGRKPASIQSSKKSGPSAIELLDVADMSDGE